MSNQVAETRGGRVKAQESVYTAAFLAAERELGERIGYPALVYHTPTYTTATATPGYVGIFRDGSEFSEAETAAELNRLRADNARYQALCDDAARALVNAGRDVEGMEKELSEARTLIAGLLRHLPPTSINKDKDALLTAARAWLRPPPPMQRPADEHQDEAQGDIR